MAVNTNLPWFKILGWAILIHIILIALSVLEVAAYSIVVNPGHDQDFYGQHAQTTAPYISIIFGIVIFYFISRKIAQKRYDARQVIGLVLPLTYIIIDIIIVLLSHTDWSKHYMIFTVSFATKILASYIGATSVRKNV